MSRPRPPSWPTESAAICRAHGDQWYLSLCSRVRRQPGAGPRRGGAGSRATPGRACRPAAPFTTRSAPRTALEFLAWTAVAEQDYPRAARLLGAADRQRRDIGGSPFAGPWAERHQQCEAATREALGDTAYDTAYRRGSELDLDEAIAYALGEDQPPAKQAPERDERQRLTRREREVAELVAQGLSNKEIAARLVIAQRTAEAHVENILTKLGFTSRAQVAAWYATQRETAD